MRAQTGATFSINPLLPPWTSQAIQIFTATMTRIFFLLKTSLSLMCQCQTNCLLGPQLMSVTSRVLLEVFRLSLHRLVREVMGRSPPLLAPELSVPGTKSSSRIREARAGVHQVGLTALSRIALCLN